MNQNEPRELLGVFWSCSVAAGIRNVIQHLWLTYKLPEDGSKSKSRGTRLQSSISDCCEPNWKQANLGPTQLGAWLWIKLCSRNNYVSQQLTVLLRPEKTGSFKVSTVFALWWLWNISQGPHPGISVSASERGATVCPLLRQNKGPGFRATQWVNTVMVTFKKAVIFTLWNP